MKCAACNTENPPNAKFCLSCGAALVAPQPGPLPPGAVQEGKSAGLRVTPTAIGIVVLLLISAAGAAYVGLSWYEDSTRSGETASVDERAIEEKRRKAEQDRLAEERQQTIEAEREKQRQQADAEQAMKLAREKVDEDRKRADSEVRQTEKAKTAEVKAPEEERAKQEARARDEAKAREQARAREEARARELARQREEKAAQARDARARQTAASSATRPADSQAYTPAPAPAPVQPAPVAQPPVAAAPAQNEPCAGLSGLKREQCTSCNRHTGMRKTACEDRAIDRYCEGKWNRPGQPDCVDPKRR